MNREVRVFQDLESLSRAAAQLFVEAARQAASERGRFLTALSGGSTPQRLFQLLASDYRTEVDWKLTHIFWADERCVPPDEAGSNYGQAREALLGRIGIPEENIHRIRGELEPAEASKDYALSLRQFASPPLEWPFFALVLLGMGADGHTASLFPGSPVEATAPVLAVTAHYEDRPAQRITLTPPVINSARLVVFMATGTAKAETLRRVLSDQYEPEQLPAQRIDPKDGDLTWLIDEKAASKVR